MISRETLEKIIEAGAQAPSGSNSQPWEFEVHDRSIDVHMLPQKDHPILNFKNRGTIFAVGTLVENIVIAADHYGFEASVTLFPNTSDHNVAAKIIILEKEDAVASTSTQLFDAIWKRSTNRKSYEKKRLDAERFEKLTNSLDPKEDLNIGIKFTDDEAAIKTLAEAASTNEVVMFENEPLHKLFFDEIVWTKKEEKERSSGLYVKTMEQRKCGRLRTMQPIWSGIMRSHGRRFFECRQGGGKNMAHGGSGRFKLPPSDRHKLFMATIQRRRRWYPIK
jgi:hypothetical protein